MRNNYPTKPPYKYTSIIFPTKTTSTPSLRTLGEMNGYSHGEVSDYTTDLSKVKNIQAHTRNRQYRFSVDNRRPAFSYRPVNGLKEIALPVSVNRIDGLYESQDHRLCIATPKQLLFCKDDNDFSIVFRRETKLGASTNSTNLTTAFVDTRRTR